MSIQTIKFSLLLKVFLYLKKKLEKFINIQGQLIFMIKFNLIFFNNIPDIHRNCIIHI